ncbi:uncharacterized protein RB166_013762 [Leptodactylus fuscus]|uniref:uncharacterized protein LOC142214575 n=1 Tax=Leptodactylus fuscus TaxID=238119 RepID=UPI003F4EE920
MDYKVLTKEPYHWLELVIRWIVYQTRRTAFLTARFLWPVSLRKNFCLCNVIETAEFPVRALLLFISPVLAIREEHAAVSSNITFVFKPCEKNGYYKIHHNNVNSYIYCNPETPPQISEEFEGRISVNKSLGRVTIHNIVKSDGGRYILVCKNGNGGSESSQEIRYVIHDEVRISELSCNVTNENVTLTVSCDGDVEGKIWTYNGGDLPDGHWLSDDNRTLIIPSNVTGRFTVNPYNKVSADSKTIYVIKDLNGKPGHLCPMNRTLTKVIWGDRGRPSGDQTLNLTRNITNICVLTSDITSDERQFTSHRLFWLYSLLVIPISVIIVAIIAYKKSRARRKRDTKERDEEDGCTTELTANGSTKENVDSSTAGEEENNPSKDGDIVTRHVTANGTTLHC